ncbi:hypothetical protein MSPP1_001154 [Malassezia sp. CBS 17886]|nr:hypothetical protein MSPP1_001154 [Malassezia sp. CBS 17886]
MVGVYVTLVRHAEGGDDDAGGGAYAAQQCHALANALSAVRFAAVYASPTRASLETAEALSQHADVPVVIGAELDGESDERGVEADKVGAETARDVSVPGEHGAQHAAEAPPAQRAAAWVEVGQAMKQWKGAAEHLDTYEVRAAMVVGEYIAPWLHSTGASDDVHVAVVAGAVMVDKVLQCLLLLNGATLAALRDPTHKSMSIHTDPPAPASYHQLHVALRRPSPGGTEDSLPLDTFAVRVVTLCEAGHLRLPPVATATGREPAYARPQAGAVAREPRPPGVHAPLFNSGIFPSTDAVPAPSQSGARTPTYIPAGPPDNTGRSPHSSALSPSLPSSMSLSAGTPRSPGTPAAPTTIPRAVGSPTQRSAQLRATSTSPGRLRPVESLISFTSSLHHGAAYRDSLSLARGSGRSDTPPAPRNLHLYDPATMLRSIEKLDPLPTWPDGDGADTPDAASSAGTRLGDAHVPGTGAARSGLGSGSVLSLGGSVAAFKGGDAPALPVASSAGLASPVNARNVSAFAQSLFGYHGLAASSSAAGPAPTADSLTPWQNICMRLLPLFNGEALKIPIEMLREAVESHVRQVLDRDPLHGLTTLTDNFRRLVHTGLVSITAKMHGLEGVYLLQRLTEMWALFYGTVVPYMMACAAPLQTAADVDATVRQRVADAAPHGAARLRLRELQRAWGVAHEPTLGGGGVWGRAPSPCLSDVSTASTTPPASPTPVPSRDSASPAGDRVLAPAPAWDMRAALLQAFRDRLVLPIHDWLLLVFRHQDEFLFVPDRALSAGSAGLVQEGFVHARLAQLVGVLGSVQTGDAAQLQMDKLRRTLLSPDKLTPAQPSSATTMSSPGPLSPLSPLPLAMANARAQSPSIEYAMRAEALSGLG